MSRILTLDPSYDLWLTYSWAANNNHGVCGHTFEVFDYYYILKQHFKVGIFFGEDIEWASIEKMLRSKYTFTDSEILEFKQNTVFHNRPGILKGSNILFTDGGVVNNEQVALLFDNIFYFACGNKEVKDNNKSNVYILQDDRVYESVKLNGINYKKRLLLDKLKPISSTADKVLVYATKNCRNIDDYTELTQYGNILAIVDTANKPAPINGIEFVTPPLDNIFEQFNTYVYTPVGRKWDCSPRFIVECKYYGKEVLFHNIDYWDIDHGLRVRWDDVQHDFESLFLKDDDEIVSILKRVIC